MGIIWEEVEVAAQNRSEWRRSVAPCIHALGCGLNQGQGQKDMLMGARRGNLPRKGKNWYVNEVSGKQSKRARENRFKHMGERYFRTRNMRKLL